jgi:hypothetical protein
MAGHRREHPGESCNCEHQTRAVDKLTDRSARKQTDQSVYRWKRPRNGSHRLWQRHFVRCTRGNDKSCQRNVRGFIRIGRGTDRIACGSDVSSAAHGEMTKIVRETCVVSFAWAAERRFCLRNNEFARGTVELAAGQAGVVCARLRWPLE